LIYSAIYDKQLIGVFNKLSNLETRCAMIDAGIDWLARMRFQQVGSLAIVPCFEGGAYLLLGASKLWRGTPPGAGRRRAGELRRVGYSICESSRSIARQALGWTDADIDPNSIPFPHNHTFPPPGVKVGSLLSGGLAEGGYRLNKDPLRNNQAALRFTSAAVALLVEAIRIAEEQSALLAARGLMWDGIERRRKLITELEDELELLMELPCFAKPEVAASQATQDGLRQAAYFGLAAELAVTQSSIAAQALTSSKKEPLANMVKAWGATARRYLARERELQQLLVDENGQTPAEVAEAAQAALHLRVLCGNRYIYEEYVDEQMAYRAEGIVAALISLLFSGIGLAPTELPLCPEFSMP